jgi:hypothetical protein
MHIKIPNFLSSEECRLIEKICLEKEQEILSLPVYDNFFQAQLTDIKIITF